MRQRDPIHQQRLEALLCLSPEDCKAELRVVSCKDPLYVPSEVLSSLVRARYGESNGILSLAAEALHRRVVSGVGSRIWSKAAWHSMAQHNSEVVKEAISYFWEKLLVDEQAVCNAEVRFGVYLANRVDDYMIHLLAKKNTNKSMQEMAARDENGQSVDFESTIEDSEYDGPLEEIIREEESTNLERKLMAMPKHERNAFYFRVECEYDWKTVARLLRCSIPTARKHLRIAIRRLEGE